jgi:hypothetical protein
LIYRLQDLDLFKEAQIETADWDLRIDFQSGDDEGLTRANIRNLRPGLRLCVGDIIVVGNEEAESGVGEVMELGRNGVAMIKVLPGSVDENHFRLGGSPP